jgi:DNA-binding PadR family transcriptional regulator
VHEHEDHHDHGHRHEFGGWRPPRRRFGGPDFAQGFAPPWMPITGVRGRGRARRGDVRVAILTLLAEQPRHGYEIIHELADRSGGAWQPSPGSVYPTLQLLEDEGLVRGVEVEGKRRFEITDEGRAHLAANPRASTPWEDMARNVDPTRHELMDAVRHVAMATHQVAEVGTDEQRQQAITLLHELRRHLYVLLASEATPQPGDAQPGEEPASEAPPAT